MKKMFCALWILALLSAPLAAEEFGLRFQEAKTPDHPAFSLLFSDCSLQRGCPEALKPREGAQRNSWFYRVKIAGRSFYAAADPSVRRMYFDIDGDADLSDEKAVQGEPSACRGLLGIERALLFGPVALESGARVMAMLTESKRLEVFPAGFMTGDITLEGRTFPVALVDANFDGRYDGVFSGGETHDVLIVDFNGDGAISEWRAMDGETAPLGRFLHLGDRYYSVKPAGDGSSISLEAAQLETGTLETGLEGAFMALWSDCGFHYLGGTEGKWELPAGLYRPRLVGFKGVDGAGRWSITAENTGRVGTFSVEAGGTQQVTFGAPLVIRLDPRRSGGSISSGIAVFGQAGEKYPIYAHLDGNPRFPPAIEVFVEDGTRIARGRFEFG